MKRIFFGLLVFSLWLTPAPGVTQVVTSPATQMAKSEYKSFLQLFMDYPQESINRDEEGKVVVEFTADNTGKITDRNIARGVSPGIDSTALSIFDYLLWKPGLSMGKKITCTSTYELNFDLKAFRRLVKKRGYLHVPRNYSPYDSSGTIFPMKKSETAPQFQLQDSGTSLADFLHEHLNFPDNASKLGISGTVKLKFVVERNGLPSNIVVLEYIGGGCTEEAIRLLELTRWIPGMLDNQYVRTYFEINILFKKGENKDGHIPNQSNTGI